MLQAMLHGKLTREQENMEDILTSNAFGTFEYLNPSEALVPFLSYAIDSDGQHPLEGISEITKIDYKFWPRLNEPDCHGCEPDVILRITTQDGGRFVILIEAKYLSGKSSEANDDDRPYDQLAREWDNIRFVAERENRIPILLYITAGIGFPEDDVDAAQRELIIDRGIRADICWLSWRHLLSIIEPSENKMLQHLAQLMRKMNLIFFQGFSSIPQVDSIQWIFSLLFKWNINYIPEIRWRFQA